MPAKFIGYFRLLEHCASPGCPVCRAVIEDTRKYLDTLLYEQVTDPDTRRRLRTSWGFCNWHAWLLLEGETSLSGTAIIYQDVLETVITRVRRLARRGRTTRVTTWLGRGRRAGSALAELFHRRRRCPACARLSDNEDRYLESMITFVDEPDFQVAYALSDGLCVPHTVRAVELAAGDERADTLLVRTLDKWATLQRDLGEFVRKHDYRNTEPYTERETRCCARAFETLAGARGVFSSDARHGRGSRRVGPDWDRD